MLSKTIVSIIPFRADQEIANTALNQSVSDIDQLILDIGSNGGMYVGDGIEVRVTLTYNEQTKRLEYVIPMNHPDEVKEINQMYEKRYRQFSQEEKEERGIITYYSTQEHIIQFRNRLVEYIRSMYHKNEKPTTGNLKVTATATYQPENK